MRGTVPPVKSRVPIFVKDLSIVLSSSASLGLACPLATKAVELFKIAEDMGMGNEDDSAVWKVHEGMRRGGKGGAVLQYCLVLYINYRVVWYYCNISTTTVVLV